MIPYSRGQLHLLNVYYNGIFKLMLNSQSLVTKLLSLSPHALSLFLSIRSPLLCPKVIRKLSFASFSRRPDQNQYMCLSRSLQDVLKTFSRRHLDVSKISTKMIIFMAICGQSTYFPMVNSLDMTKVFQQVFKKRYSC